MCAATTSDGESSADSHTTMNFTKEHTCRLVAADACGHVGEHGAVRAAADRLCVPPSLSWHLLKRKRAGEITSSCDDDLASFSFRTPPFCCCWCCCCWWWWCGVGVVGRQRVPCALSRPRGGRHRCCSTLVVVVGDAMRRERWARIGVRAPQSLSGPRGVSFPTPPFDFSSRRLFIEWFSLSLPRFASFSPHTRHSGLECEYQVGDGATKTHPSSKKKKNFFSRLVVFGEIIDVTNKEIDRSNCLVLDFFLVGNQKKCFATKNL